MASREDEQVRRRLLDLADTAWQRGVFTFSDFLDLHQQSIFHSMERELSFARPCLYGGFDTAERQMAVFVPEHFETGDTISWPVRCLMIRPRSLRFAEELSHRDYLGSLMNLGLDRSRMGDLVVRAEGAAVFCHEQIAEYLCEQLTRVRHTPVTVSAWEGEKAFEELHPPESSGSVPSARLDAVLSCALHLSRSSAADLIRGEKVFVNGRMVTDPSFHPDENDLLSVRGSGRIRFLGESGNTRKGRIMIHFLVYQ